MENVKVPTSIGIILDGNRRLAKRLMKRPWEGHEFGVKKVKEFLHWCRELGIRYVTLYSFSIQNFNRPKYEFNFLMKLFKKEFSAFSDPEHDVHKYGIKVKAIGRLWLLPKDLQRIIKRAEKLTEKYKNYFLNIAIAYGGQEEITDAIKELAKKVLKGVIKPSSINEKLIEGSLYTDGAPYPDLIIRTGGEQRLSNFLLWQSAYSELSFSKKMWPEFTKLDFLKIIKDFQNRDRRFGH